MRLSGEVACEGPGCERRAHVGPDTMELGRLPVGHVRLTWYGNNGVDGEYGFCSVDCVMKWCSEKPPEQIIDARGIFGGDDA